MAPERRVSLGAFMPTPSISLLVLKSPQMEVVCDFYRLLGFDFVEEQHGKGPVHFAAPLGTGVLEIYPLPVGKLTDTTTRIGFNVSDINSVVAVIASVEEVASKPKATQWGVRAVVRDPDGRTVELCETLDG